MNAMVNPAQLGAAASPASPAPLSGGSVLAQRAVLARPTIRIWAARKHDKRVSEQAAQMNNAGPNAGRFNKQLIAKAALSKITTTASRARDFNYLETLAWRDDGSRLLPSGKIPSWTLKMTEFRHTFEIDVHEFCQNYEGLREQARAELRDMFRESDYPSVTAIRDKFSFEFSLDPVPCAEDFRVEVGDYIRSDIERRADFALKCAMRDVAERIGETVGHMATKLREIRTDDSGEVKGGIFRDTLFSNVQELADMLPGFNVGNDPELDRITSRVRGLLAFNPETVRTDPTTRALVADEAKSIVDAMGAFYA